MRIAKAAFPSLAGIALSVVACGGTMPPPNDEWAAAQADVGRAQSGGAPAVPDARLHLQLAEEDLQKSKELMDHDNRRATSLVAVARVEAQLALSIAKAQLAQGEARKAQEDLQKSKGAQ
ncbi:MAG: DUF4398 domain-containing protein [Myxococcota bacterium]|nr:DUF4398 domain-containing protein [Myxococcota bacterium]